MQPASMPTIGPAGKEKFNMSNFKLTHLFHGDLVLWERMGIQMHVRKDIGLLMLGGETLASAKNDTPKLDGHPESQHCVYLMFHGGRQTWMVESMKHSPITMYPRDDVWGTLNAMMQVFMDKTGIELPPIRIIQSGMGISTYTRHGVVWDSKNPFQLDVGRQYRVVHRKENRIFEVVDRNGVVEIAFTDLPDGGRESFRPHLILDHTAWLTLKQIPVEQPTCGSTDEGESVSGQGSDRPRG